MADVQVEVATPDHWRRVRTLRLAALEDAPDAFWSTLEEERDRSGSAWREWADRDRSRVLVATIRGRDAGIAVVGPHHEGGGAAGLYAVWVTPEARGRGVGDALVSAGIAQATAMGHARILLDVGDDNDPAIALYERWGFAPTGRTSTFPAPRDHISEHELALDLPPPGDR